MAKFRSLLRKPSTPPWSIVTVGNGELMCACGRFSSKIPSCRHGGGRCRKELRDRRATRSCACTLTGAGQRQRWRASYPRLIISTTSRRLCNPGGLLFYVEVTTCEAANKLSNSASRVTSSSQWTLCARLHRPVAIPFPHGSLVSVLDPLGPLLLHRLDPRPRHAGVAPLFAYQAAKAPAPFLARVSSAIWPNVFTRRVCFPSIGAPRHDVTWELPLCWCCCSAYSPSVHLLGCNIPASFRVRRLMAAKHLGCKVNRLHSMQARRGFTHAHALTMIRETCASAQTIDCSFCGAYAVRVVISMTGIRNSQLEADRAQGHRLTADAGSASLHGA